MGGKAILFVILGFSITFLVVGRNFNSVTNRAVDNMVEYHNQLTAHNIAVSGANMACNEMFIDPTWTDGYNMSMQGGTINLSIQVLDALRNIRQINSYATFKGLSDTVRVVMQPSRFSKFAYYSASEGGTIWWTTGDTVRGPFHTQDYLRVSGRPVYFGKVSTKKSLVKKSSGDKPQFLGGFNQGVDLPINNAGVSTLETFADAGGYKFPTGQDTVYLTFVSDSIKYKYKWNGTVTTKLATTFAPNGVIFAKNSVLRLQGTVKGQYTVVCSGTGSEGDVYLDDNIVYKTDPLANPNSTDILGIVAQQDVIITENIPNKTDIKIHASIYAQTGGFTAQNYSTRPYSGNIWLVGGIIQNIRGPVGTISGGSINHGFNKNYRYDDRFMFSSPPNYPNTGSFEIVSWYE